jgi:hypothetical protein
MPTPDDIGGAIERLLDHVEHRFAQHGLGSLGLGAVLALGVIAGGLAAFIAVFAVLVRFFS